MTIYLIGDSHVRNLGVAYAKAPSNFVTPKDGLVIGKVLKHPTALKPFFAQSSAEVCFQEEALGETLRNIIGASTFRTGDPNYYLICMPYVTTVWLRLNQWRTFEPWRTCKNYKKQPLSDLVIREMVLTHFRYLIDFILALQDLKLNIAVLEAPPPRSDDRAGGYLSGETILELDRLARDTIDEALQDVPVIRPPAESYDELGFLRQCYRQLTDRHHANDEYGAVMLSEVLNRAREIFPALEWLPNDPQVLGLQIELQPR